MDNEDETNDIVNILEEEEDYITQCIGAFGVWQLGISIVASLSRYTAISNMLSIIFLIPKTDFYCVSFEDNLTTEVKNSTCYETCVKYEYINNIFDKSLISDFELICDKAWMGSFTQTVLMLGFVFGVSLFGFISDKHGRRIAFLIANYANIILMISVPFSPNYWSFNIFRFLIGIFSGGILIIGILFVIENVGPEYRDLAGTLVLLPDGFCQVVLSGIAYYSTTWRAYLLANGLLSVFVVALVILLPETPRWLISKRKAEDAIVVLKKAAKCAGIFTAMHMDDNNNVVMQFCLAFRNKMNISDIDENVSRALEEMSVDVHRTVSYVDLFKTKGMPVRIN